MFIGFDYGTSNCSVAIMKEGKPTLLPLEGENVYIPSTLCAPTRESVSEHLFRHLNIKPTNSIGEQLLRKSIAFNRDEDIELVPEDIVFGQAALSLYLKDPRDVYYVKSPKSFLGASGLHEIQISFFEDLVCAMMANIKQQAEKSTQTTITDAMIGKPINFNGLGGEAANKQAERILINAAKRAGFKQVLAQKDFYSQQNLAALNQLRRDAQEPEKIKRLIEVYNETLGYGIVRKAEEAKMALSDCHTYLASIALLSETLETNITRQQMVEAIGSPKDKMIDLVNDAVQQGGVVPDVVFMTGGSARSPILCQAIEQQLPNVPIVKGNDFGSVTAGLARWGEVCFK
ncbi:TPA: molecular chaperone [Proteus mirabilis]|nr:molecular chaperone [Proteus mirabilis]